MLPTRLKACFICRGKSAAEMELAFLEMASKFDTYGAELIVVKVTKWKKTFLIFLLYLNIILFLFRRAKEFQSTSAQAIMASSLIFTALQPPLLISFPGIRLERSPTKDALSRSTFTHPTYTFLLL